MNKVVLKSYFFIKIKGYAGKNDKYIASGLNDKGFVVTDDYMKATKFEYFGLRGMEKSLSIVMDYIAKAKSSGINGSMVIGSNDVYYDLDSIDDSKIKNNMRLWSTIIDENTAKEMVKLSVDEEGERSENYVQVSRFLHHIRMINARNIMDVAMNWSRLDNPTKVELSVGYSGEYSASRFNIYMDYLSDRISGKNDVV